MTELNEAQRQHELDRYRIVDSLPDEAYDDIVKVAAAVCAVPAALVSMIDRDRQWFKARTGFEGTQTPRDEAFCDHAIRTPDQLFEVSDATRDARFADYPSVIGSPDIRFYAGMPLVTPGGAAIGTVCVWDKVPRTLDYTQRSALSALARLTMNLIQAKDRQRELERSIQFASAEALVTELPAEERHQVAVAIFEVQDTGAAIQRVGERGFERLLQALHDKLESNLHPASGDNVSRVSGCAELVALLRGTSSEDKLRALRDCAFAFGQESGLKILVAASESLDPDERLELVFQRADEALTQAKDATLAHASTA